MRAPPAGPPSVSLVRCSFINLHSLQVEATGCWPLEEKRDKPVSSLVHSRIFLAGSQDDSDGPTSPPLSGSSLFNPSAHNKCTRIFLFEEFAASCSLSRAPKCRRPLKHLSRSGRGCPTCSSDWPRAADSQGMARLPLVLCISSALDPICPAFCQAWGWGWGNLH